MHTILVVEDNDTNAEVLTGFLTRDGFQVVRAENGRVAVEKAREIKPDLVLMDMSMPEMDGWEATRLLKTGASTSHIPVIAVTAHVDAEHVKRAVQAGCDQYITKPVIYGRLKMKLRELLDL